MSAENQPRREPEGLIVGIRGRSGGLICGIVLVVLGVIFLLQRQGVLPSDTFWHVWPLIFVFVGIGHLFGPRRPKDLAWGALIILFGVALLLGEFGFREFQFQRIWPFGLIALGIFFVWSTLGDHQKGVVASDATLDSVNIFGGGQYRIGAKNFRGGRILAIFGGFELDLRQADIEGQEAVIEVNALFGGGEIKVPETWHVVVSGMGVFGGYGDETRPPATNPALPEPKTLILKGVAMFGGVGIKN
jgi:predicted membrane protein